MIRFISEHNGDYCVNYPSNIYLNTRSFENWRMLLGYTLVLAWGYPIAQRVKCQRRNIAIVLKIGLLFCWSIVWLKFVKHLLCSELKQTVTCAKAIYIAF